MEVFDVPIREVNPAKYNPRKISDKELTGLKESIKKFGFIDPLVINKRTNTLVGGHQRLKAAELLEMDNVPVVYVNLNISEEKALNIALNSHMISGKYDLEILPLLLDEIKLELPELSEKLRFNELKLDLKLDTEIEKIDGLIDDDEIPKTKECRVKKGDIWSLGNHRLMCGDSTIIDDVEKLMNDKKADLWIADPPFGVSYIEKNIVANGGKPLNQKGKQIKGDTKSVEELCPFWRDVAANAYLFTTMEAANYWCACQGSDKMMMMMMMMDEAGWNIRHELIWVKDQFVLGRSDYHYQHEPIIYGWKKKGKHNWFSDRKQSSVFNIDKPKKSDFHPTTKPVELFENFFKNSCPKKGLILESFGGSGTSIIASEKLNMECYTMELDEKYCDVIINRWEQFTGKKAELINEKT